MRAVIVGLGVQGHKRAKFAGGDLVATVDPVNKDADHQQITELALDAYDAALVCVPDEPKVELLTYLLSNGKHVLVEKPLFVSNAQEIIRLQQLARKNNVYCYTAYNHRFEPHFVRMKQLIDSGQLGKLYHCRMFYGNGTARLVRNSVWRDQGSGVLPDLGSHLLDTLSFWFGASAVADYRIELSSCHENQAPDHVIFSNIKTNPQVQCEMMLLSWRNHFVCDLFAEHGSAHIRSLCKWGPTTFTHRTRVLPSGKPPEQSVTLVQDDPTWQLEYAYFKQACLTKQQTDLTNDVWIHKVLQNLARKNLCHNNLPSALPA